MAICQNPDCGKPIASWRTRAKKYCSRRCNSVVGNMKTHPNFGSLVCKGTAGAISELLVCADLLRLGYAVFRAVSPNCSCDLVILTKSETLRVEVKSAVRTTLGKVSFATSNLNANNYDILALVLSDRTIEYRPPLPTSPEP